MIVFPNAKINLGLHILRKRSDNFHDLETVFFPLPLFDVLELLPAQSLTGTTLTVTGTINTGTTEDNLCLKAYKLLKADYPQLPVLNIHLHKSIPAGAGLGGGSADAAAMLLALNKKFDLGLDHAQLLEYALQLGSDCPFFLRNIPSFASGRGEQLEAIDINVSGYTILLVNPGIHVSTAEAFSRIVPSVPPTSLKEVIALPVDQWRNKLRNDFELPVFALYPEIENIKTTLYDAGAVYAAMSGSGSSVFGLFKREQTVLPEFAPHYFIRSLHSKG